MRLFDELAGIKHSSRLMQLNRFLWVMAVCGLASGAFAQPPQDVTPPRTKIERVITLQECLELALKNNLDIKIQRYNPMLDRYALGAAYAAYEPVFDFSATKSFNSSPGGINSITGLPFNSIERETESYNAGISGILPTGLTYDLSGPLSKSRQSSGTNITPATWSASPGVTLSQPLLRNLWIDSTRLQIQINKTAVKISEQVLRQQVMTTVTDVKRAYYELIYARENVEVNKTALALATQLAKENAQRVEIGVLARLDEREAESQAATSKASLLAAQHNLAVQENALKSLLTDSYDELADVTPIPAEQLLAVPQVLSRQESWRRAFTYRPDLLEQRLSVERQNVTLKFDYNQLYPQLNVVGSYGLNAFTSSLGTTLGNIGDRQNEFYSFGAVVSIPLGNRAPRANYRASQVTLQQLLLLLKSQENFVKTTVDNAVGLVEITFQQVEATHSARLFAQEALDAERIKLDKGKSTSFQVLQFIERLTAAKSAEIRALADYNVAQAQLTLEEGATLQENKIDFKDK